VECSLLHAAPVGLSFLMLGFGRCTIMSMRCCKYVITASQNARTLVAKILPKDGATLAVSIALSCNKKFEQLVLMRRARAFISLC